jgi:hypothetical protein
LRKQALKVELFKVKKQAFEVELFKVEKQAGLDQGISG